MLKQYEKWSVISIFGRCGPKYKILHIKYFDMIRTEFLKNCESMLYIYVPNAFDFDFTWNSAGRSAERYEQC